MNATSRQTFALVCDLTTFVHVADLMRFDLRDHGASVSLIELKSGKVNRILLSQLEDYKPEPQSIELLKQDPRLDSRHIQQAERMLRQKIRLREIRKMIRTDHGIDISSGRQVRLVGPERTLFYYDEFLDELCKEAMEGMAALTVQEVLHFGAGFADDEATASRMALAALDVALRAQVSRTTSEQAQVREEVLGQIDENQAILSGDLLGTNLVGIASRPFLLWEIGKTHKVNLVSRKMKVVFLFDLANFIWLGRSMGLDIRLGSRKAGARIAQQHGRKKAQLWGNRPLQISVRGERMFWLGRPISLMICSLCGPTSVLHAQLDKASKLKTAPESRIYPLGRLPTER